MAFYTYLGFLVIFFYLAYKYLFHFKRKSNLILAEVERIEVQFLKNYKGVEPYIGFHYKYSVKRKKYSGFFKIPFSLILENQNQMELIFNEELQIPILKVNNETYIGDEAIEYKLLQLIPSLPIRYLTSDPARNFVFPLNKNYSFFRKTIKRLS
ncbi:MAG: hypothetical protein RMI35_08250 [Leptospiraceae bacterium]|nr:hypothetical protein [Leptospiraceae bacterium]